MAIKIECNSLITTVEIGKKYFPEEYAENWYWNDGVICWLMISFSPNEVSSMIEKCEKLGLKRFKEENGKKVVGDYFIVSHSGCDRTLEFAQCDWIRIYNDVAWHLSFPMGKDVPAFPCYRGGYYYKSKEVWDRMELALEYFNKVIDTCYEKPIKVETFDDFFKYCVKETPFDSFFQDLELQTSEQQSFESKMALYERHNLKRFVDAHHQMYSTALAEIRLGKKHSHWMWYIFPQLKGLGHSSNSDYYGIDDYEQAVVFLHHPELGRNLREITEAMLAIDGKSAKEILGGIDAMKFRSSMTLFDAVCPHDIFSEALQKYYKGKTDEQTLEKLKDRKLSLQVLFMTI